MSLTEHTVGRRSLLTGTALALGTLFAGNGAAMQVELSSREMTDRLIALVDQERFRVWRVEYRQLNEAEKVFRSVWELEAEVSNGGFHQYFFNSSGALASYAASAFRSIGAARTAEIVEAAVTTLGTEIDLTNELVRQDALLALGEDRLVRLDELDREFFAYPDDLTALLYRYVSEHRREVGAPKSF